MPFLLRRMSAACLGLCLTSATAAFAQSALKDRHIGTSREQATSNPRSEGDQAIVNGWPLYRTERGQTVFNEAMATLKATEGASPQPAQFRSCPELMCALKLPQADGDGWLQPGRLWVAADQYVLIVKSPRQRTFSRRGTMAMKVFIFHEFHNSSRNTDMYDTISSHSGSVFVPFYLGKTMRDAQGRSFVVIAQVAPLDVSSVHATNFGSAGPGVEVAKNTGDALEPLQGLAGIVLAAMVKAAAPRLNIVNHRGSEGQASLQLYQRWEQAAGGSRAPLLLPFVPVTAQRVASASAARVDDLILRKGALPKPTAVASKPDDTFELPSLATGFAPTVAARSGPMPAPMLLAGPRPVARPDKPEAASSKSAVEASEANTTRANRPWFRWLGLGNPSN